MVSSSRATSRWITAWSSISPTCFVSSYAAFACRRFQESRRARSRRDGSLENGLGQRSEDQLVRHEVSAPEVVGCCRPSSVPAFTSSRKSSPLDRCATR